MSTTRRRAPRLAGLALAACLAGVLSACGADSGDDVATDPAGTTSTTTPTPSSTPSSPSPSLPTELPTEPPKPPNLPDFPYADYSYTLGQLCFCANVDQRYRVTVEDGQVTGVAYATAGEGHAVGDAIAEPYLRLTIQDIIDKGNAPGMAKVRVVWPAGQAYPDSVYIDQMANVADEEVTWLVSDVDPA